VLENKESDVDSKLVTKSNSTQARSDRFQIHGNDCRVMTDVSCIFYTFSSSKKNIY
jgi:hypothetical protein